MTDEVDSIFRSKEHTNANSRTFRDDVPDRKEDEVEGEAPAQERHTAERDAIAELNSLHLSLWR